MDKQRGQRLASLIEEVADSCAALDGQNAVFEYVFYPLGRAKPVAHRSDPKASIADLYFGNAPCVSPDCRLKSFVEGLAPTDGVDGEKLGMVDVYFIGKAKAVERLRELSARVGRLIPADWEEGLNQYVPDNEAARERARCLAWLGRLCFLYSKEAQTVDVCQDKVGPYYLGVVDDAFWQLECLLKVLGIASKKTASGKERKHTRRQPGQEETNIALTAKQTEALQLFTECQMNYTKIGRRMGIGRKSAEQHVKAAHTKMGLLVPQKAKTTNLLTDKRGQANVVEDDDGGAKVIRNSRRNKPVKDD